MITYFLICLFRRLLVKSRTYIWQSNGDVLETTYHYDGSFENTRYSGSCTVWYVVNPDSGIPVRRCSLSEEKTINTCLETTQKRKITFIKKLNNMKNWNWKQWTAFGLVVAVIIVGVILHLVQPEVSYALLEMVSGGTFVLGGFATWLFMKGKTPVQINS